MNAWRRVSSFVIAGGLLATSVLPVTMYAQQNAANTNIPAEQLSVVGSIRSINTAEAYYAKEYKKGWSQSLAALGVPPEGTQPSAAAAGLLDKSLTNGTKANHVFTYKAGKPDATGKIGTYTLSVRPVNWREGLWSFYDDNNGVIRGTSENRAATVSDPPLQ